MYLFLLECDNRNHKGLAYDDVAMIGFCLILLLLPNKCSDIPKKRYIYKDIKYSLHKTNTLSSLTKLNTPASFITYFPDHPLYSFHLK